MHILQDDEHRLKSLHHYAISNDPILKRWKLKAYWVPPDTPIQIWDRVEALPGYCLETADFPVTARYIGETPDYRSEGKHITTLQGSQKLCVKSSIYRLRDLCVVLEQRGTEVVEFAPNNRLLICDKENRGGWPALLEVEPSRALEETNAAEPTPAMPEHVIQQSELVYA